MTAEGAVILMAEDDPDDRLLVEDALEDANLRAEFRWVGDGDELLDYLLRRDGFQDQASSPRPGLILLDLSMPRRSGSDALAEIKRHPELRSIPVVILTTSRSEEDIRKSYDLGAASYISKPVSYEGLVEVVQVLGQYWFEVTELPPHSGP